MIIIKTKNGAKFVNEKEAVMIYHDKKAKQVSFHTRETMQGVTIHDVESVTFITDTQAVEWKDEGSEIERLKAELEKETERLKKELEKEKREKSILYEHFGFIREWFFIYQEAFDKIHDECNRAKREYNDNYVNPLAIIEQAEKKYQESQKRFEKVREKWDEK